MGDPFNGKCVAKSNDTFGRYLVANQDLQAGETILKEDPMIVSPLWHSSPRCANCFRETSTICKSCKIFPLCSHCPSHNNSDCVFMGNQQLPENFLVNNFSIFAPLKVLLLIENDTIHNAGSLLNMECHSEQRKGQFIWEVYERNVVKPIMGYLRVSFTRVDLNEQLIQKICGIFDVNAFEIRGPDDGDVLRAIYSNAALLAHSCIANTLMSVDDGYQMKVYATQPIKTGEVIYYNYTSPLMGTVERRKQLKLGKYFLCECNRCMDPTELGTHMSSILCEHCKGLMVQSEDDQWICMTCSDTISGGVVQQLLNKADQEIKDANGDLRTMEMLLIRYSSILSPTHHFVIDLKQNIASILRDICMNPMNRPGKKVLERKVQLCNDIMPVLEAVEPGISRLVGIACFEKFTPLLQLTKMEYEAGELSDTMYLSRLQYLEQILKKSIQMLLFEQVQSAEGRLLKTELYEMSELRKKISSFPITN